MRKAKGWLLMTATGKLELKDTALLNPKKHLNSIIEPDHDIRPILAVLCNFLPAVKF